MDETADVYEKHRDELIRFATVLVGPSMAEDVMSAAVLRAFASPSWTSVRDARPYLYRAVANEAHSVRRSASRRLRREERAAGDERVDGPSPVRASVLAAMRSLTVRQRAVVFCAYWQELPVPEIALRLGISVRTAERELAQARRCLEVLLRD